MVYDASAASVFCSADKVSHELVTFHIWTHGLDTLLVTIIPGVGQMCKNKLGAPRSSRKWDWAILTHGNGRYVYYTKLVFSSKIEKRKHLLQAAGFGTSMRFHPPGQPSRKDESTPGADVSISPSGFHYEIKSTQANNKKVNVYHLDVCCELRNFVKWNGMWRRPGYCELLSTGYKHLATLWSVPAGV